VRDPRDRFRDSLARHDSVLQQPGFDAPVLDGFQVFELRPGATVPSGLSVTYRGAAREGVNWLIAEPGNLGEYGLEFTGVRNIVCFGADEYRRGRCQFLSRECTLVSLGGATQKSSFNAIVYDPGSLIYIGKGTSSNGTHVAVGGGKSVLIGEDCMFSSSVDVRASDIHAVVDLVTGEVLNPEADVVVGPHVWVGPGVVINKGICVGAGSILAGGSILTKDIPAKVLAAGIPASVKRADVSWTRKSPVRVNRQDIDALTAISKLWV
jgi:acetyltransferase-like isoleucine patch superfamily enzyme